LLFTAFDGRLSLARVREYASDPKAVGEALDKI
jgi:hypothetical protein